MAEHGGGGVLRELLAVFGFGVDTKELEKGESKLSEFFESVKHVGEAIAGVFAVHEISEWTEANVHAMSEIEHASERLGISTDRVQEFQFAAKSLGMDADALVHSMGRLQVSADAAAQGQQQAITAFHQVGVSVKDANGNLKSADQLMLDVAEGIKNTTDPTRQAALATQFFGRQGRELLPFLKEGREGFADLQEAYKELGGGYTEEAIAKSKAFEKQSAKVNLALMGLKSTIMSALLPVVTSITKGVTAAVRWFSDLAKGTNLVQAAMLVLGGIATAFAVKMAIAFAPILIAAGGVAMLVLLVEDLIGLFEGKDSLIGTGIDKIFGKDAHLEAISQLKDIWHGIAEGAKDTWAAVKPIWDFYKWIVDNASKLGNFIGDQGIKSMRAEQDRLYDMAKAQNGIRGRGGLTDAERRTGERAQQYLESQITGAPFQFRSSQEHAAIDQWVAAIKGGQFQDFLPRVSGPALPGGAGGGAIVQHNTYQIQAHDPAGVRREIEKHHKNQRREAAATFQRAPQGG